MNNIYVEGEEKICVNCPFLYSNSQGAVCKLSGHLTKWTETFEDMKSKCQIKPLSDRLAEERKKVVQDVREKSYKHEMIPDHSDEPCGYEYRIYEKRLNEIERGE